MCLKMDIFHDFFPWGAGWSQVPLGFFHDFFVSEPFRIIPYCRNKDKSNRSKKYPWPQFKKFKISTIHPNPLATTLMYCRSGILKIVAQGIFRCASISLFQVVTSASVTWFPSYLSSTLQSENISKVSKIWVISKLFLRNSISRPNGRLLPIACHTYSETLYVSAVNLSYPGIFLVGTVMRQIC